MDDMDKPFLALHAYEVLADVSHNWRGRDTAEGQQLLAGLRDWVAEEIVADPQEIQDLYAVRR